jgi:hypothetical protein
MVGKHHNAKVFGPGVLFIFRMCNRNMRPKVQVTSTLGLFPHSAALTLLVTLLARHRSKIERTNLLFRDHGSFMFPVI